MGEERRGKGQGTAEEAQLSKPPVRNVVATIWTV